MVSLPCQTQGGGLCGVLCVNFFFFFFKPSNHLEKQDKALVKLQPGDLVAQNPETTLPDC